MYSVGQTNAAIQNALDSKLIYEMQEIHTLQEDTTTIAKRIEFPPGQMRCLVDTTFTDAVHTPLLDATSVVAGSVSCGNIYTKNEVDAILPPQPFLSDARITFNGLATKGTPILYYAVEIGAAASDAGMSSIGDKSGVVVANNGLYFISHSIRGQQGGTWGMTQILINGSGIFAPRPSEFNAGSNSFNTMRYLVANTTITTAIVSTFDDLYSGHLEVVRLF